MSIMKSIEGERAPPRGMAVLRPDASRAKRGSHRVLRWTFLLFTGAIAVAAAGFVVFALHVSALVTPNDPPKADGIIVLTGGLYRLDAAVDLLKSDKGERLLISGVNPQADRNDLREATGGDPQLFSCCVDIDHAALDTVGNATESAKWVDAHDFDSVLLVTNNYHMPRSLLELRRILHSTEIRPYPVVNTTLKDGSWLTNPDALRVIATEYVKFVAALARGLVPNGAASASHERNR